MGSFSGTVEVCYTEKSERVRCSDAQATDGPYATSSLSLTPMVLLMTANNFGYVLADVAMDSLSVEYAKREHPDRKGEIQGLCYTIRAFGFLVAFCLTGFGFNGKVFLGDFDFSLTIPQFLWIL